MGTNGMAALKAGMAGAHTVQVVAALLIDGPGRLARIRRDLSHWLEERKYESLAQVPCAPAMVSSDTMTSARGMPEDQHSDQSRFQVRVLKRR